MPSICVQTFKDLAIPFSTLPSEDKNDYALGTKTCEIWLETAASTAIAAGFFFTNIAALKTIQYAFKYIADVFDPCTVFIIQSTFFFASQLIYSRFDSHADVLCLLGAHIHYGFQSYRSRNYVILGAWVFLGTNAIFADNDQWIFQKNDGHILHRGSWRRPIRNFAKSWAPTMATLFGYQDAEAWFSQNYKGNA
jgi:hypothetical protein